jgi:hypothetical protein
MVGNQTGVSTAHWRTIDTIPIVGRQISTTGYSEVVAKPGLPFENTRKAVRVSLSCSEREMCIKKRKEWLSTFCANRHQLAKSDHRQMTENSIYTAELISRSNFLYFSQ